LRRVNNEITRQKERPGLKSRYTQSDDESNTTPTLRKSRDAALGSRWSMTGFIAMLTVSSLTMLPSLAHAFPNGCVDSPENPSVVLGLAGGAVVGLSFLWTRWRSK
jgi:hypothetical protein